MSRFFNVILLSLALFMGTSLFAEPSDNYRFSHSSSLSLGKGFEVVAEVRGVQPLLPSALIVSNSPETVFREGTLMRAWILPYRTTLIYFYHLNSAGKPLRFNLSLYNPSERDVSYLALRYLQKGKNFMRLGHKVALSQILSLFSLRGSSEGIKLYQDDLKPKTFSGSLPPEKVTIFVDEEVRDGELITGYLLVQPKGRLALSISFVDRDYRISPSDLLVSPLKDMELSHQRGITWRPIIFSSLNLLSGDSSAEFYIGDLGEDLLLFSGWRGLSDSEESYRGMYAGIYLYYINLVNDRKEICTYKVVANPRGGKAMLSMMFKLDEDTWYLLSGEPIPAYQKRDVLRITLKPNSIKRMVILTLPEGASYYPMKIFIEREKE